MTRRDERAPPRGLKRALAAGVLLLCLCSVPGAEARTRCSYSGPPQNLLTVTADKGALTEIRRRGERIVATELLERTARCSGGAPTVLNTDTVRVVLGTDDDFADLFLGGGPLGPGATPETEGASEIEIEIEFAAGTGLATVHGTRRADEFLWGPGTDGHAGLNLNPRSAGDTDVDLTVLGGPEAFLNVDGGAGDDTIVPAPGAPFPNNGAFVDGGSGDDRLVGFEDTQAMLDGGDGNDVLVAGGYRDLLFGWGGNDRITAGGGRDLIVAGRGRDLVRAGVGGDAIDAGPGADLIFGESGRDRITSRDSSPDKVRCGAGRDRVDADRRDRLHGCEAVHR